MLTNKNMLTDNLFVDNKKIYTCKYCDNQYSHKSSMSRHMKSCYVKALNFPIDGLQEPPSKKPKDNHQPIVESCIIYSDNQQQQQPTQQSDM
jgi:hypothetical protein